MDESIDRRRRLSNLFNPPETGESSSTSTEEESVDFNEDITDEMETPAPTLRRSTRKKIKNIPVMEQRRITKPMKLTEKSSVKEIKKYYLDKNLRLVYNSLETIFEEPQVVNDTEVVMSTRRFKRQIDFNAVVTKYTAKMKRRKAKANSMRNKKKAKKVSMEFLMEKLNELDE